MARFVDKKKYTHSGEVTLTQNGRLFRVNKKHAQEWYLETDRLTDTVDKVLSTPQLPKVGDVFNGRMCKRVSGRQVSATRRGGQPVAIWHITAEYDNELSRDPLKLPPEVQTGYEEIQESVWEDLDGKPIVNANGERIPMLRPITCSTLSIRKYELPTFPWGDFNNRMANRISTGAFWGWPAKAAYMLPISGGYENIEISEEDSRWFYHANYQFKFLSTEEHEDPWVRRPLHYGSTVRPARDKEPARYLDNYGRAGECALDEFGCKLAKNAPPEYLEFKILGYIDLGELMVDRDQLLWNLEF